MINLSQTDLNLLKEKYSEEVIKERLEQNYPIQYLIGDVNFYGYKILVDETVFIPRYETEYFVEKIINYLNKLNLTNSKLIDICSGSGCISISLKKELQSLNITAIELSDKSIKTAQKSAKINEADITFKNQNIFDINELSTYDVIISNPPYVGLEEEVDPQTKYEPQIAIFENKEIEFYKHIIDIASKDIKLIGFEIGMNQGNLIKEYAQTKFIDYQITIEKDLTNKDRYIFIIKNE